MTIVVTVRSDLKNASKVIDKIEIYKYKES